jgi:Na+/glutamate symporter
VPLGICSLSLCFLSILYDVLMMVMHAVVTFRSEVFALFYFRPVVGRKYLIKVHMCLGGTR